MRILEVTSSAPPYHHGGAANYYSAVSDGLADAGASVVQFVAGRYSLRGRMRLKRTSAGRHQRLEVIDSSVTLARRGHESALTDSDLEAIINDFVNEVQPDIVHWHDSHALPFASLATVARRVRTVVTIHNYLFFCAERDLFRDGASCADYRDGEACLTCNALPRVNPWTLRAAGTLDNPRVIGRLRSVRRGLGALSADPRRHPAQPPVDRVGADFFRRWRACGIKALGAAAAVHCYSRRSAEIVSGYLGDPERIRYLPISTPNIDRLTSVAHARQDGRPVVFQYRGGLAAHKGVPFLLDVFAGVGGNWQLDLWGSGSLREEKRVEEAAVDPRVRFRGRYAQTTLQNVVAEADIGLVPSLWEEVFGLVGPEYLNASRPVLASDLGGMRDYITSEHFGQLLPPGNLAVWRSAVQDLIDGNRPIPSVPAGWRWTTVEEHARSLLAVMQS